MPHQVCGNVMFAAIKSVLSTVLLTATVTRPYAVLASFTLITSPSESQTRGVAFKNHTVCATGSSNTNNHFKYMGAVSPAGGQKGGAAMFRSIGVDSGATQVPRVYPCAANAKNCNRNGSIRSASKSPYPKPWMVNVCK